MKKLVILSLFAMSMAQVIESREIKGVAESTGKSVGRSAESLGKSVGGSVRSFGQSAASSAESLGKSVGSSAESIAKSIAGSAVGGTVQSVGEDVGGAVESIGHSIGSFFGGGSSEVGIGESVRPMTENDHKSGTLLYDVYSGKKTRVEALFEIFKLDLAGGFSSQWEPTPYRVLGVLFNFHFPDQDYIRHIKTLNKYDDQVKDILQQYHNGHMSRLQALYNTFQLEVDKKLSPGFLQYCCYRPLGVIFDRDWSMPA